MSTDYQLTVSEDITFELKVQCLPLCSPDPVLSLKKIKEHDDNSFYTLFNLTFRAEKEHPVSYFFTHSLSCQLTDLYKTKEGS